MNQNKDIQKSDLIVRTIKSIKQGDLIVTSIYVSPYNV
jgi:hypothetical protein